MKKSNDKNKNKENLEKAIFGHPAKGLHLSHKAPGQRCAGQPI